MPGCRSASHKMTSSAFSTLGIYLRTRGLGSGIPQHTTFANFVARVVSRGVTGRAADGGLHPMHRYRLCAMIAVVKERDAMDEIALAPYRVEAYNTAHFSENKIHDDEVARRYGFSGGLVPGVDVYAYMTHAALARWGRAWLERGRAECRFLKPVYEGETATVTAVESDGGLAIT